MIDFKEAREKMVDCQVRTCDVTEHNLISAMLTVPREEFVPASMRSLAYIDEDLRLDEITPNQRFLMEPAPFSKLAQLAGVEEDDFVLVVGVGSGYTAAVLSHLASSVIAIEEDAELINFANENLSRAGYSNVAVLKAPLSGGYPQEAPFDVVFFDGSIEVLPECYTEQLAEGGRLICVQGEGNAAMAKLFMKKDGIVSSRDVMNCSIKALPGFERPKEFSF